MGVDAEVFTTIKVPKRLKRMLHGFKARLMARKRRRISDAEAIAVALRQAEKGDRPVLKHGRLTARQLAGFIKGGKPFNAAKELDDVVYGR